MQLFYVICIFQTLAFTVEVIRAFFSHVPITEIENIDILVKEKPTEFRESCVLYVILYTTCLFVLQV